MTVGKRENLVRMRTTKPYHSQAKLSDFCFRSGNFVSMNISDANLKVSPWLSVEEVAERLHYSTRTVHELTRTRRIPHVKRPGSRRCLFRSDDLALWEHGAELEVTELPQGGRVVRPRDGQRC